MADTPDSNEPKKPYGPPEELLQDVLDRFNRGELSGEQFLTESFAIAPQDALWLPPKPRR
jgi:hypothetical protein